MTSTSDRITDPRVESALERALSLGEIGIQVTAYLGNQVLIDTWAGHVDANHTKEVEASSLFSIFSVTKALAATALHVQAQRGLIEYDAPLSRYWPEYARNGKDHISVQHVLSHRAGVPQMPLDLTPTTMNDWKFVIKALQEVRPLWEPDTRSSYLSYSFGWLLGEIVCRTDPKQRSFEAFVGDEILAPLGAENLHLRMPEEELERVTTLSAADLVPAHDTQAPYRGVAIPAELATGERFNSKEIRTAVNPSAGAVADARSVARLFGMLANGGRFNGTRVLSPYQVRGFLAPRKDLAARDEVTGRSMPIGIGGYFLGDDGRYSMPVVGTGRTILAQPGAGGSVGWADLDLGLSAAICHNRMFSGARWEQRDAHPFEAIGVAIRQVARDRLTNTS